jgi:hypothetical protein
MLLHLIVYWEEVTLRLEISQNKGTNNDLSFLGWAMPQHQLYHATFNRAADVSFKPDDFEVWAAS